MNSGQTEREGLCPFPVPGVEKDCYLWYRVIGPASISLPRPPPLVVLHGGPGLSHDYLLSLTELSLPPHRFEVIFWDQLGCGKSTLLPEKLGDTSFWTEQLHLDQLSCLLQHLQIQHRYAIFGNSWGGMLAAAHAALGPPGLEKAVLASTPFSSDLYTTAYRRYRDLMPSPEREVLMQTRTHDTPETAEYVAAIDAFNARYFIRKDPIPLEVLRCFHLLEKDNTVWKTM